MNLASLIESLIVAALQVVIVISISDFSLAIVTDKVTTPESKHKSIRVLNQNDFDCNLTTTIIITKKFKGLIRNASQSLNCFKYIPIVFITGISGWHADRSHAY